MRKEIILNLIKEIPGVSYNEIVRKTELSNGVISHYIIKLMESGEIEKEGVKRGKYFFKNIPKKDRIIINILRNKTNNEIFRFFIKNSKSKEASTAKEIAEKVKKSGSTVSVSLKILQKNDIIERMIMNKNSKLTNDIGYVLSTKRVWSDYSIKFNL